MSTQTRRIGLGIGIGALVMALAGGAYFTERVHAQGRSGPGGPGRPGGPGGTGGPGGPRGRGPGGPMGGPGAFGPLMLGRLDLSEAQRAQVKQVMDSHRDEQMALGERGRVAHEALDAVVNADTFDEGAVRARAGELAIVDADMMVARARVYNEVLQPLTPDQRAQLTKRQAQMKERQGQMQQRQKERRDSGR